MTEEQRENYERLAEAGKKLLASEVIGKGWDFKGRVYAPSTLVRGGPKVDALAHPADAHRYCIIVSEKQSRAILEFIYAQQKAAEDLGI